MTNMETIQKFIGRTDLTAAEQAVRKRALSLDERLAKARQEAEAMSKEFAAKQSEVTALTHQLEGVLTLILDLATPTTEPETGAVDAGTVAADSKGE
jgi:predicted  nucleic acid-binding Zn-ribbon protein